MKLLEHMKVVEQTNTQSELSLKDIAPIVRRRKWIIALIVTLCLVAAVVITIIMPQSWQGEAQMIMIQRVPMMPSPSAKQDYSSPIIETVDTPLGMLQSDGMIQRTLQWLKNDAFAKGQSSLSVDQDPDFDPLALQKSIGVTNPKDSNILDVTADASNPEKAALLTNAVCQAFVQWRTEIARKDIETSEESLAVQAKQARAQMIQAEKKLLVYQKSHGIVDTATQTVNSINAVQGLDTAITTAKQDLASQQAHLKALAQQLKAANLAIKNGDGVRDDTQVLSLQTQLTQAQQERADAAQKYRSAYPGMLQPLDAKIKDLQQRFAKAVQNTQKQPSLANQQDLYTNYQQTKVAVDFAAARVAAAVAQRSQAQATMYSMPQSSLLAQRLQRDAELAASQYTSLRAALSAARLDLSKVTSNIQITQPASPPTLPYEPKPVLNVILGLIAGGFLSLIVVLLVEQVDRRIRGIEDVRRLVAGPILGLIPTLRKAQMAELAQGERMPLLSEAVTRTRVNLTLGMLETNLSGVSHRTILVTSAGPGEGKSLVAAQLAQSFANAGQDVLLVDANLHRPTQKIWFGTGNRTGLADVILGEIELEEAIASTQIPRVSVLHSGASELDPTDLLSHPQAVETFQQLRARSGIIVIDAPDCASVADVLLLAPYADCVLQVIAAGRMDETRMQDTAIALRFIGKPLGFIVNKLTPAQFQADKGQCLLPQVLRENGVAALGDSTPIPSRNGLQEVVYAKTFAALPEE